VRQAHLMVKGDFDSKGIDSRPKTTDILPRPMSWARMISEMSYGVVSAPAAIKYAGVQEKSRP
jgi:hypothetical protein